jgi:hypothetical protein
MRYGSFSDSFYHRAIRTGIGKSLRTLFVPTEPPPERLLKLLLALDQPKGGDASGIEEKQDGRGDAHGLPEERREKQGS